MINILVYNERTNSMERYARELYEPMPYNTGGTLTVGEFRARSYSNLIWTTRRTMENWNRTRSAFGRPIDVGYAFRRIGEGGHGNQSQHYAGTAFDVGQGMGNALRNQLRTLAAGLGIWGYVEPAYLTPTWVHMDARTGPPACSAGYPLVRQGSRGVYVCVLQDALDAAGIPGVAIDGMFGPATRAGVVRYQQENGLTADGIVGCATWTTLTAEVNGIWREN